MRRLPRTRPDRTLDSQCLTAVRLQRVAADHDVLPRLTPRDHKELADLMGLDPTRSSPKPAGSLGTDLHKPLSEQTAEQVAKALAGQGGARPQPGKPAAKAPEQVALVLAYNPVRPRPGSPEVKRFLDGRQPTRPGTVQVLLVLRGTNG